MRNLKLEIDDEVMEFNIPEAWNDVTVKEYEAIASITREDRTDIEIFVEMVSKLTGMDEEIIYMVPVDEFDKIGETLKFAETPIKQEPVDFIELDGEQYWLKKDFESLTMGETISIEAILERNEGKLETAISQLLCIFLRKKKDNGKLEGFKNSFMDRAESFGDVKITDVHNLFLFFSTGRTSS